MKGQRTWINEGVMTLPSFGWLVLFFLIPTLIVVAVGFKPSTPLGGVGEGWTLSTFYDLINVNYLVLLWRTLWLSCLTTAICIALSLPIGYYLAQTSAKKRNLLLLMIIVPFWSSFLIRIFAWKSLLHPEGAFKQVLVLLHLATPEATLLYNSGAVLLVMVYTYLPFAILPIYAGASKFNFHLIEAAMDLGAARLAAYFKIFIPGLKKSIVTAAIMVFVPAIGAYVIPDLVGGTNSEMIGNKIAQKTLVDKNLPVASALSTFLGITLILPMALLIYFQNKTKRLRAVARNRE